MGFINDLRFAVRILVRTPAVTFAAILALAVSIGANTAIFGVVNAVLLEPLPYHQPDRLVTIWNSWHEKGFPQMPVLPSDYLEWRKQATVFDQFAASQAIEVNVTGGAEAERVPAARASANLFPLLGVRPALGRGFLASDTESPNVVVLADSLWRRRVGGRADAVGQALAIDGRSYTIVGVMPRDFRFSVSWSRAGLTTSPVDLWIPLALRSAELNDGFTLTVLGRLKPGVTQERAEAELRTIGDRISAQTPDHKAIGTHLIGLRDLLTRDVRPAVLALAVAVGLVLLIACANVANLLLSKASVRRREIAVRAALGASRGRLIWQVLTESLVLGAAGGACGVAFAWAGTELIVRYAPVAVLRAGTIDLDTRTLAFTGLASLLSAFLFGLAPAFQAFRVNLDAVLRESARGGVEGGRQGRLRSLLVVGEIALAVLLLVGAGLLLRSFVTIVSVDPGFRSEGLTTARISLPASRYASGSRQHAFFDEVLARVRALPEVSAAAATATPPLEQGREIFFRIEGQGGDGDVRQAKVAGSIVVDPQFFTVMRIPLTRGRQLDAADAPGRELAVVVDETLARRYWPGQDPVGRRLREGYSGTSQPWMRVVGVVGSVRQHGLTVDAKPTMYVSYRQFGAREMTLVARGRTGDAAVGAAVRAVVRQIDPDQPVAAVRTMEDLLASSVAPRRFSAVLLAAFAALALLLSAVGVYAVMSYSVACRAREIGIRKALGASPQQLIGEVLRRGLALDGLGLGIGCLGAVWLTRYLASELHGVEATDPWTFGGACLLLLAVAGTACYAPARRASAVDPVVALRHG